MTKGDTITIRRTANGFLVHPQKDDGLTPSHEVMVFQDIGYAASARDYQKLEDTLLGFIAEHFGEAK